MSEEMARSPIHMVITIVDRGRGDKVVKLFQENHIPISFVSLGHGTARSEMLDRLGLGETKKDTIMCLAPGRAVPPLLDLLAQRMQMKYPGKGIAFSIPLSGVSGRMYHALNAIPCYDQKEAPQMEQNVHYEMVITLIDRGCTDLVMEAARKVGAPGGTVLSTRSLADEDVQQFLGISIQAEKELVFLVVPSEKKQDVMQAISHEAGLNTPARGIVLSVPVSHAIGLA